MKILIIDPHKDPEIKIPSAMIERSSAEYIIKQFKDNNITSMDAIIDFKVLSKSDVVNQKIVFNPFDKQSFDFFTKWKPVQDIIRRNTLFEAQQFSQHIINQKPPKLSDIKTNCVSKGKYCLPQSDVDGLNGVNAIKELIKMMCQSLNQDNYINPNLYTDDKYTKQDYEMEILNQFQSNCQEKQSPECIDDQFKSKSMYNYITKCLEESFDNPKDLFESNNTILEKYRKINTDQNYLIQPAVEINGTQLLGSLTKVDIFDEICQSFNDRPIQCDTILSDDNPNNWDIDIETGLIKYKNSLEQEIAEGKDNQTTKEVIEQWWKMKIYKIIAITVVLIVVIGLFIQQLMYYVCLRSYMDNQINQHLNQQVKINDEDKDNVDNWDNQNKE